VVDERLEVLGRSADKTRTNNKPTQQYDDDGTIEVDRQPAAVVAAAAAVAVAVAVVVEYRLLLVDDGSGGAEEAMVVKHE
jgi:hypothetical protein